MWAAHHTYTKMLKSWKKMWAAKTKRGAERSNTAFLVFPRPPQTWSHQTQSPPLWSANALFPDVQTCWVSTFRSRLEITPTCLLVSLLVFLSSFRCWWSSVAAIITFNSLSKDHEKLWTDLLSDSERLSGERISCIRNCWDLGFSFFLWNMISD